MSTTHRLQVADRLDLFDRATGRHEARKLDAPPPSPPDRGWTREELYERGRAG